MDKFEALEDKILNFVKRNHRIRLECINTEHKDVTVSLSELVQNIENLIHPVDITVKSLYKVDGVYAQRIVSEILHKTLAYGTEIMSKENAEQYANEFVSLFGDTSTFFTNAVSDPRISGWNPMTHATFGIGVFVVGKLNAASIFAEDED